MRFRTKSSRSGFLLPAMAGLLLAMGSAATVVVVQKENLTFWQPKTESTQDLGAIRSALIAYQRDNHRLPCVASRSALPGATNYGTELADCSATGPVAAGTVRVNIGGGNFMRLGALPHVTLKLGATGGEDRWASRFTYAITEKLADPYQFSTNQGALILQDAANSPIMATAAWVVISHGADGKGAFSPKLGNTTPVKSCAASAGKDQQNCDYTDGIFRKMDLTSEPGANFFDDMVAYEGVDTTAQQMHKPCQRAVIGDATWDGASCTNNSWTDMLDAATGQNISNTNTGVSAGTATLGCNNGVLTYSAPVCNSHCLNPGTRVWGAPHDCSATVPSVNHGASSASIPNTVSGRTGNATFNCNDGALALGAWTCTPSNCGANTFNWPAGCTGTQASLTHGNSATVTNTAGTYDGSIIASCNYGQYTSNNAICNAKCPAKTFNWGAGCTANVAQMAHAATPTITNTNVPYTGSQTLLCNSGTWSVTASSCFAHCAATTLGWPAGCSAPAAAMSHGQSGQALTNSAAGYTGTASASCTDGTMTAVGSCYQNCNSTPLNWGPGSSCSATPTTMTHGQAAQTITDAPTGYVGSASITCNNGTFNVAPVSCSAPCTGASVSWSSNCYGSAATMYHGQASQSVTDTTPGYTGTSNVTCNNGSFVIAPVSCAADPCVSQTVNWSGAAAGCSATYPGSASGTSGSITNAVGGKSGAINYTCTAGTLSTNTPTCYNACSGTVTWGSCSAFATGNHGQSGIAITNTAGGFQGSATGSCTNGTMSLSGTSCVPTVNGVCGAAAGGHTTSAPSSSLCATGSPTAVTGSGPYNWSCTGSGGGSTAACSSNRACAGTTISWNGAVAGCNNGISDRNSGTSGSISNAVAGRNGSTTWSCTQGTWSNSSPSCNGNSCTSAGIGWSGATSGCTGTAPGLAHGAGPTGVTNVTGGKTGSVNVSCSFGAFSQSGATCANISGTCTAYRRLCDTGPYSDYEAACTASGGTPQTQGGSMLMNCLGNTEPSFLVQCCGGSCPNQTVNWSSCSASLGGSLAGGTSTTVTNTAGGFTGSVVAACDAGTLSQSGASCVAAPTGCAAEAGYEWITTGTYGSTCMDDLPALANGAYADLSYCADADTIGTVRVTCNSGVLTQSSKFCQRDCFLDEVEITLADGTSKPISELKEGDKVKGKSGDNTVLKTRRLEKTEPIYGFNGEKAIVTSGHPFMTKDGWKAIDPTHTPKEGHNVTTTKLEIGDAFEMLDGTYKKITSIDAHDLGTKFVNSPSVSGDETYYANGMLVHNKINVVCTPINGVCNNSTPLGCNAGTAISDNGQTSCGTNRTWVCEGLGGGSNSGTCSYNNGACGDPCFDNGYGTGCLMSGSDYGTGCIGTDIFSNGTVCCAGCTLPPSGCSSRGESWTGATSGCTGTTPALGHGASTSVTNVTGGKTGSVSMSCNNGTLTQGAKTCANVPARTPDCYQIEGACPSGEACGFYHYTDGSVDTDYAPKDWPNFRTPPAGWSFCGAGCGSDCQISDVDGTCSGCFPEGGTYTTTSSTSSCWKYSCSGGNWTSAGSSSRCVNMCSAY